MPTHVPRSEPTKKLDILARREAALRSAVSSDVSREKLYIAAEAVRIAHLNVIKAKLAALRDRSGLDTKIEPSEKIARELKRWREISPAEIVMIYQKIKSRVAD